jgi:hypothetical protein
VKAPAPGTDPGPATAPAGESASLKEAVEAAKTALANATSSSGAAETDAKELADLIKGASTDPAVIKKAEELATKIGEAATKADTAATEAEAAATKAETEAAAGPEAAKTAAAEARKAATDARTLATAAKTKAETAKKDAELFAEFDPSSHIARAELKLETGDLKAAKKALDDAKKIMARAKKPTEVLDYTYGRIYDGQASAKTGKARLDDLKKAKGAFESYAGANTGEKADLAKERARELTDEITKLEAELAAPAPAP